MLKLYPGNRSERLAECLATLLAEPLRDPFEPEIIVTQTRGMAHWLSLQLAQHLGIAANQHFLLPAAMVWDLFRRQNAEALPEHSAFDRSALNWRIFGRLQEHLREPAFAPLRAYLAGDNPELKRYQLALRIADLFDQYLVFRPDLIDAWDAGAEPNDWQAELWRDLSRGVPETHRVVLMRRFLQRCAEGDLSPDALPQRISVFGVSTMPPAHLEVLAQVSRFIDVHVFFFNPCREYWGDLADERAISRSRRWRASASVSIDSEDKGHVLLASMGQQGRDFFERLLDVPTVEPLEGQELFEEPGQESLLASLQSDILNRIDRSREPGKLPVKEGDDSVGIHVCHSPMREIEVLHDRLLDLFERQPDLELRDVVVMAPDIETYAPYIEAVFTVGSSVSRISAGERPPRLPCTIADRAAKTEHPVLKSFLALLQLPASRLKSSEVLSLLQTPEIRRRYHIGEEEFERIHRWTRDSGIRWGADERHREEFELPGVATHSWDFGLDRLFFGYALGTSDALCQGVAPFEDIEGQAAEALGKLQSFLADLERTRSELRHSGTPQEWSGRLNELFDRFFAVSEESAGVAGSVRDALALLQEETYLAGFDEKVQGDVIESWLQRELAEPLSAQHFCTGRITFCSLLPMRSVPFRIVCLLGMNDTDFPRSRKPIGFDRIALVPRPGDRSRREDDRYLFLEVLLSARDRLHISYVGRNIRDNSELLPSVVVSELLDYLERNYVSDDPAANLIGHLRIEHPMQPFSTRYFEPGTGLFSYAAEWVGASSLLRGTRTGAADFSGSPIAEPDESFRQVHIEQLVRFYRNPTRYFLENRLRLFAAEEQQPSEDSEPFALDALQHYQIKQALLQAQRMGGSLRESGHAFAAQGILPETPFDRLALERDTQDVEVLWGRLQGQYAAYLDLAGEPYVFELELEPFRLYGVLHDLSPPGLLVCRAAKLKARDRLALWIRHLALHAGAAGGWTSIAAAEDQDLTLGPIDAEAARVHLRGLLQSYWAGLREPLRFFPETSFAYLTTLLEGGNVPKALDAAAKVWEGGDYLSGEGRDAAYRLIYRTGVSPFDPPFEDLAAAVFQPLIEAKI